MQDIEISDRNYEYQVGGSLKLDASSYITRQADRQLYEYLKAGEFCYILSSRQVGKSSLRVRTRHRLQQEGFACASLDLTSMGSSNLTPQQWYKGIAAELWRAFNLTKKVNFNEYWLSQGNLPPVQALSRFIEDVLLLHVVATKIFVFIDEIDSVLNLDFSSDDFFALIRSCYDRRADDRAYEKLTFALFGVATPSNLIRSIDRTPFNIGKAIEMSGFNFEEAFPLTQGLNGKVTNSEEVVKSILTWTGGQPFLTQKLCQLVLKNSSKTVGAPTAIETDSIESLVKKNIIEHWETHDELEHLKTIRDRLVGNEKRAIALLGIYQQILHSSLPVIFNGSSEQMELLLSGLVVKRWGHLEVYNPIYQAIFNSIWLETQLTKLRIYADPFDKWLKSERLEQVYTNSQK
jgi:adenylate cyclase